MQRQENNRKVKKQISRCSLMRQFVKCRRGMSWYRSGFEQTGNRGQGGIIGQPLNQRLRGLRGSFHQNVSKTGRSSDVLLRRLYHVSLERLHRTERKARENIPLGTMMMTSKTMMPMIRHILIFMSFHHICFLTLLAPRLKPCAETARLSVLSCRLSRRSPRSETLLMLLRMTLTVESISCINSQSLSVRIESHLVGDVRLGGQRYAGCRLCWRRRSGQRECRGRKAAQTLWRRWSCS